MCVRILPFVYITSSLLAVLHSGFSIKLPIQLPRIGKGFRKNQSNNLTATHKQLSYMELRLEKITQKCKERAAELYVLEKSIKQSIGQNQCLQQRVNTTHTLDKLVPINTLSDHELADQQELSIMSVSYYLLPHLIQNKEVKTNLLVRSSRMFVDIVIGIPTVRRKVRNYLIQTLTNVLESMSAKEKDAVLIIVHIGELNGTVVYDMAKLIHDSFSQEIKSGLIEIVSPSPNLYPDFKQLTVTLNDNRRRFTWRTKQNLDYIHLMNYAKDRGIFFLLIEDDVKARNHFVAEILDYTTMISLYNKIWIYIEYCTVGAIGKLFKSSQLNNIIIYLQMFYTRKPVDWLFDSYIDDIACSYKSDKNSCERIKERVRPQYPNSLFSHIGYISSLRGKTHKVGNDE